MDAFEESLVRPFGASSKVQAVTGVSINSYNPATGLLQGVAPPNTLVSLAYSSSIIFATTLSNNQGYWSYNIGTSPLSRQISAFVIPSVGDFNIPASAIFSTLDPSNTNSNATLSNGNLSITPTSTNAYSRGTFSRSYGKLYLEVLLGMPSTYSTSVSQILGVTNSSYLFGGAGGGIVSNVNTCYFTAASSSRSIVNQSVTAQIDSNNTVSGVYYGIGVDFSAQTFTVYNYSTGSVVLATSTGLPSGALYPFGGFTNVNSGQADTFNFGQTPFYHPIPAGYSMWG